MKRGIRPDPETEADPAARRWTAGQWLGTLAVLAAVLMLPAVYNRFPLIFPDTNTYVGAALGREWPLDRSGFYGLFAKPFMTGLPAVPGAWLVIAAQCVIISAILVLAARRLRPGASIQALLVLLVPLALFATLPWHAAQLMPDALTGALVLSVWMAATRDVSAPGTPLLWVAAGLMTLVHYTHIGLMAATAVACLAICAAGGVRLREVAKRGLAAALALAAVLAAHVTVNGSYFGRWSVSPMGGMFLFARVHEDGLVQPWFDRHCGKDAPKPLCEIRDRIPADSQVLLWGYERSPFDSLINSKAGQPETWPWVEMMGQAAIGSIKERPLAFANNTAKATAEQFFSFRALDDECPDRCQQLFLDKGRPALIDGVRQSRQLKDEISRGPIRSMTDVTSWLGLLLLLPLTAVAVRRRDRLALSLLATTVVALVVNAAMTGGLSDVHDRYQSRVIWLAPLIAALIVTRWMDTRAAARGEERAFG